MRNSLKIGDFFIKKTALENNEVQIIKIIENNTIGYLTQKTFL